MRKPVAILLAFAAAALLYILLARRSEPPAPEPAPSPESAASPAKPPSSPQTPEPPVSKPAAPAKPADPEAKPYAGPRFYDFPIPENPPSYPPPRDDKRFTRTDDGKIVLNPAVEVARSLNDPAMDVMHDLEQIDGILFLYRWLFQQNPVGDNEDVVRQLTGSNSRGVVVLPPDHPSINANGELLDRFGNPYFFHAVSETQMDIWSYGEDGVINTIDDFKLHGDSLYDNSPDPEGAE